MVELISDSLNLTVRSNKHSRGTEEHRQQTGGSLPQFWGSLFHFPLGRLYPGRQTTDVLSAENSRARMHVYYIDSGPLPHLMTSKLDRQRLEGWSFYGA